MASYIQHSRLFLSFYANALYIGDYSWGTLVTDIPQYI